MLNLGVCFIVPALFILFSAFIAIKAVKKGANRKVAVFTQIGSVVCAMGICTFLFPSITKAASNENSANSVSAVESAKSNEEGTSSGAEAIGFSVGLIAAALALGLSGVGAGIAVASAAPAAIAANSENPKTFGKSLVFVALGEAIAIYGFVVSIMILNKIDQLVGV